MNIFKTLINKVKNLDKQIKKIMRIGFKFSFIITIISVISLFTYAIFYSIPTLCSL